MVNSVAKQAADGAANAGPIKVGILHSLTGTMAFSEAPLVEAALMAIAEINATGGLLGRQIAPIVKDSASTVQQSVSMARQLLEVEQVATVFGCWTSLSRKAVVPLFEASNTLLWYPVQYEGLEESQCVFYTGLCLNQQIEPALDWLLQQGKRSLYLVGSDYVFPRVANKVIKSRLKHSRSGPNALASAIVGEDYVPLGAQNFEPIIARILQAKPDAIFNTINGDSNISFYQQAQAAGIRPEATPIMAMSLAEVGLQQIGPTAVGHYACWSYFQSLDTVENHAFVARFKHRYGADRVTSDPIEAAYTQVYLWHQAAVQAQTIETDALRQAMYRQSWQAPGGVVHCLDNHHLQKECRIGQVQANEQFKIIYSSRQPIKPLPWLGMETDPIAASQVVIEMLSEVSNIVQYSWELEQAEADLNAANLEITELNKSLQAENVRMSAQLEVARKVQQMVLPRDRELEQIKTLDIAAFMQPADEMGGDYYDVLQVDGVVTIAIGDVSGHGLESGLLMLMTQTAVRTLKETRAYNPVAFLETLNRTFYQNVQRMNSEKNITLSILTYLNGRVSVSGQHEEVLLVRNGGTVERIDTIDLGLPLGLVDDIARFVHQVTLRLYAGDGIVLYTDGIPEAYSADKQQYGLDRLCEAIAQNWQGSAENTKQLIINDFQQFIGEQKLCDDITVLVIKCPQVLSTQSR